MGRHGTGRRRELPRGARPPSEAAVRIDRRHLGAFNEVLSLGREQCTLVAVEAHALHRDRLATLAAEGMDRRVRLRLEAGDRIGPQAEALIRAGQRELIRATAALFDESTFVACPTVPVTAPELAPLEDDDLFFRTNGLMLRNTMIGSFLNWAGISIPNGFDEKGLPTGFLLSGGQGFDGDLLSVAMTMEPVVRSPKTGP